MGTTEHYKKLADGKANFVIPPRFTVRITSVIRIAQINTGKITMTFVNGKTKSRNSQRDICCDFNNNFQAIIDHVTETF